MASAFGERPRFYEGQFLSAADLSTLVDYMRSSEARHALGGHSWGIAIGLQLTERSSPGAPKRVEVTLQPGFAWDGFGRPITNARPTRLPEDLFADIAYNPTVDDVAAGGTGRLVQVWLAYSEIKGRDPAPGFETCATDDQASRIDESFRFEIGAQAASRQRSPVAIGPVNVDAVQALSRFDPAAPAVWDGSVPHQDFPLTGKPPRWLVPVGYVRWIARDGALGYFAERELAPADKASGRIRAFRRYIGSVAEYIEAADGAIVLHRRSEDPTGPHRFANLLAATLDPAALLDDLVWVEGNIRIVGDARLCDGRMIWRDGDGRDQGTDFHIARGGDDPAVPAPGKRELRVTIGPAAQADNRLVIGPEQPPVAPADKPIVAPHLVVVSSGDIGIGRRDPEARLNVVGARIRLQDSTAANARKLDLTSQGGGVGVESPTSSLTLRAFGPAPANQVLINPEANDGRVGIRVKTPQHDIDAKGHSIKLGLEEDGGGQLVLTHSGPNNLFIEARNAAGTAPAPELRFIGPGGANLPLASMRADLTHVSNRLVVGHAAPGHDVDIRATRIKLGLEANGGGQLVLVNNANDNRIYLEGFSADGNGHAAEMLITGRWATTLPHFTVRAATAQFDGNVGIGTGTPLAPLHVAGATLRVDGPAGQQAVMGAEINGAIMFGSPNAGVNYADMRRLSTGWDTSNANAWLTVYCRQVIEVSDERAKERVRPLANALDRVSRLRGVSYRFRGEENAPDGDRIGLIAQEVRAIVPEAVPADERRQGVAYSALVPLLIEAIKDLKGEVETLRAEVAELSKAATNTAAGPRPVAKKRPASKA